MKEPSTFFFFCSRSNFRAVTRLETLATQASSCPTNVAVGTRDEPLRTSSWEASNFADKHIFCSDVFKRNSREKSAALISARFFSCLLIFFIVVCIATIKLINANLHSRFITFFSLVMCSKNRQPSIME